VNSVLISPSILQIFEGSFLAIFGVKFMKEWINIILASIGVFDLWLTILRAWEDGRILDGTRSLPHNPIHVGKSTLSPLVGLSEY
jgi:hypothetical protein